MGESWTSHLGKWVFHMGWSLPILELRCKGRCPDPDPQCMACAFVSCEEVSPHYGILLGMKSNLPSRHRCEPLGMAVILNSARDHRLVGSSRSTQARGWPHVFQGRSSWTFCELHCRNWESSRSKSSIPSTLQALKKFNSSHEKDGEKIYPPINRFFPLDPFSPILPILTSVTHIYPFGPFGPIWTILDLSGLISTHLDPSDPFGPFRPSWTLWTLLWTYLDPFGVILTHLNQRTQLDPVGPMWTNVDPRGGEA